MADTPFSLYSTGKVALSSVLPALWSGIRGDPNAETLPGRYIPGAAQTTYGGLGDFAYETYNALGRLLPDAVAPAPVEVPETFKTALGHAQAAGEQARLDIPTEVAPQNAPERVAQDVVRSVGQALPLPGVGAATARLPGIVRAGLTAVAPGLRYPGAVTTVGGTIAGVQSGYEEYKGTSQPTLTADWGTDTQEPQLQAQWDQPATPAAQPTQPTQPQPQLNADWGTGVTPEQLAQPVAQADTTHTQMGDIAKIMLGAVSLLALHRPATSIWRFATQADQARKAAAFNEAVGLRTGEVANNLPPGAPLPDVPPVNVPGDTGLGTRLNSGMFDETARTRQLLDAADASPSEGKEVSRLFGIMTDRVSAQTRERELLDTGVVWQTKERLPRVASFVRRTTALPEPELDQLRASLNAADELDNRNILLRRAQTAGETPALDDPNLRYSMWDKTSTELQAAVDASRNHPVLGPFMNEYNQIKNAYIRHVNERGLISDLDARNVLITHPNHVVQVDPTGHMLRTFGERELAPRGGPAAATGDPIKTIGEKIGALMRSTDLNDRNRIAIEHLLAAQERDPSRVKLVTAVTDADGGPITDKQRKIIKVGSRTGAKTYEIHDDALYHMLDKGDSMLPVALNGLAHATQMQQSFITGLGATLTGRVFPLTQLPRAMLSSATERPTGFAGGILDKVAQKATGGRLGLRAFDPTSVGLTSYEALAGMGAQFVKGLANSVERGTAPGSRMLRAAMGDEGVRKFSDYMMNVYLRSNLHDARSGGLGGAGAKTRVEGTSSTIPRGIGPKYLGEALRAPPSEMHSVVPELYTSPTLAYGIRTKSLLRDMNDILNDAANLQFNRLNRDKSVTARAYETSQLVGGVGTRGSHMRVASAITPYLNPSMQGLARTGRAFKEAPLGTLFGKIATYSMILAAERWLSLSGGPAHQDVIDNQLTPHQRADNAFMQFNPLNPMDYMRLSLPQSDRMFIEPIRQFMRHAFVTDEANTNPDTLERLRRMFSSFFDQYVTQGQMDSMMYGGLQNIDAMLQPPTALSLALAAVGKRLQPDITKGIRTVQHGGDLLGEGGGLVASTASPNRLPGQDADLSSKKGDEGVFGEIMSTIFGTLYQTGSQVMQQANQAETLTDFFKGAGDVMQQRIKDLNPNLSGTLFSNTQILMPRGSYAQQQVRFTMDALKPLEGMRSGDQLAGMTRKGGEPVDTIGGPKMPTDPTMLAVFEVGDALRKHIDKDIQPHINDLDKQMAVLDLGPGTQAGKREARNAYAAQMHQLYIDAAQLIAQANDQATIIVGSPVDFAQRINWQRDATQFLH